MIDCDAIACPFRIGPARQRVTYKGDPNSSLVLVGEAPGEKEDLAGLPFVGAAGQILDEIFSTTFGDSGIVPLYTNVVWCRPPYNRQPRPNEINLCTNRNLKTLLRSAPRKLIIALGNTAWKTLRPTFQNEFVKPKGIRGVSGIIVRSPSFDSWIMPTFHPAASLYDAGSYTPMREAFYRARRFLDGGAQESLPNISYMVIQDLNQAEAAIDSVPDGIDVCLDIETTGLEARSSKMTIFALYWEGCESIPVIHYEKFINPDRVITALLRLFQRCKLVGHNVKFDGKYLAEITGNGGFLYWSADTMIEDFLVDENRAHGLKPLESLILNWTDYEHNLYQVAIKAEDDRPDLGEQVLFPIDKLLCKVPLDDLAKYNAYDVVGGLNLHKSLDKELDAQGLQPLYRKIILPLVPVLAKAEQRGLLWSREWSDIYGKYLDHLEASIQLMFETNVIEGFNPGSYKQVSELLFETWNLPKLDDMTSTDTGNPSTNDENLRILGKHIQDTPELDQKMLQIIQGILAYRCVTKLNGTYIKGIHKVLYPDNSIHTHFLFAPAPEETDRELGGTVTGRLSSVDPNCQNFPPIIKALIRAREGYKFVEADYSQIELRGLALSSGDEHLLEAILSADAHSVMAKTIWPEILGHLTVEEIKENYSNYRQYAKNTTYLIMYRGGPGRLARMLGIPFEQAVQIQQAWLRAFPKATAWLDAAVGFARKHGYVIDYTERRRRLPLIWSEDQYIRESAEKQACNSPIQGLGADIPYMGISKAENWIQMNNLSDKAFFVNVVHDGLLWEVADDIAEQFAESMKDVLMITLPTIPNPAITIDFPVEIHVDQTWKGVPNLEKLQEHIMKATSLEAV